MQSEPTIRRSPRPLRRAAATLFLVVAGCGDSTAPAFDINRTFSFETNLEGWVADTVDTGDPPIEWTVERTTEEAIAGEASVKFEVDNLNDAAKVWIERPFYLRPNTTYTVTVGYDFATADFGMINNWTLITGVTPFSPETVDDLTFQEETGTGSDEDVGHVWLPKSYVFTATTGTDGRLYVAIGVWGTFESLRIYYLDDVQIRFSIAG